jgi:hypothetical protein
LKRGGVSQRNEQGPRKPKRIDLTNLVALAETEANRLHPNAKLPNCVPLIDIKRQKEVLQQILIDVIAFRGSASLDPTAADLSGASAKAARVTRNSER